MKAIKLLLLVVTLAIIKTSYAQVAPPVSLSNPYPQAGKKITITYNTATGLLKLDTALTAKVYYSDNNKYPVDEIRLKKNGELWIGDVTIIDSAKAFLIKITGGSGVDSNAGKGYIYLIYKNKMPIQGAYAAKAYIYTMYKNFGINNNDAQGIADYKKEIDLYPANRRASLGKLYTLMARNCNKADMAYVNKKLNEFKPADNEKDYSIQINALYDLKKTKSADSLREMVKAKFPKGTWAAFDLYIAFNNEKDLVKKDSIYNVYTSAQPADPYMTSILALAHLRAVEMDKYEHYKRLLPNALDISGSLTDIAYTWAKQDKNLPEADTIAKEAFLAVKEAIDHPVSHKYRTISEIKQDYQPSYDNDAETYNYVLYKEGKHAEAARLQAPIYNKYHEDANIADDYALMLIADSNYDKAVAVLTATIKGGTNSIDLTALLKQCYIVKNGGDKGFDDYLAQLNALSKAKAKEELAKSMLNDPAPEFTLKDLDGNAVSLASLKGKTVVVDFWATWCGPCKASMPGMQIAINKYKDDPYVKFLFIDVWENGDDYLPKVKKFIDDNKYPFTVLIDEKDKSGQQAKVISQFKVSGIPTKFIIDRNGIIRFKHVGFDGTDEAVVNIVSSMIDMAKDQVE